MRSSLWSGSRVWIVAGVAIALAVAVVVGVLAQAPRSHAADDPNVARIQKTVSGYEMAIRTASDIPAESLSRIEEKVADLAGKATASDHVLSQADKDAMNRNYAAAIDMFCTPDMAESMGTDIGSVVDETLVAGAAHPEQLVIEEQRRVMAVQVVKKGSDSEAYAWAYFWTGDVYARDNGPQNWEVIEYRLLCDQGSWRIDGSRSLGVLFPENGSTEFGPYSPHDSVDNLEMTQESELAPGQPVPLDLLRSLEATALSRE